MEKPLSYDIELENRPPRAEDISEEGLRFFCIQLVRATKEWKRKKEQEEARQDA